MNSSPKRKRLHAKSEEQGSNTRGTLGLSRHESPCAPASPRGQQQSHEEGSPRAKVAKKLESLHLDPGSESLCNLSASLPLITGTVPTTVNSESNRLDEGVSQGRPTPRRKDVDSGEATVEMSNTQPALSPLGENINDEFWSDAEITGHKPTDPDDDGYGLNGLGFQPTTAIAYSRSQRRKQQMADYRYREAREARRQRLERRRSVPVSDQSDKRTSTEISRQVQVHFETG